MSVVPKLLFVVLMTACAGALEQTKLGACLKAKHTDGKLQLGNCSWETVT
jgi:hypothetical protein